MRRREFIFALGGAAAGSSLLWPLAARAQKSGRVARIGWLSGLARPAMLESSQFGGFLQGMRELDYVEGRDFTIEWRFAESHPEGYDALAAELARQAIDVFVAGAPQVVPALQRAARAANVKLITADARSVDDFDGAFASLMRERVDALVVISDVLFNLNRRRLAELATMNRLPSMFSIREYAEAGGLMSYGESFREFFRRAASFVDKILKGAKAGDLPFEQPNRFFFTLNLKAAKAIGLNLPESFVLRADEVIE